MQPAQGTGQRSETTLTDEVILRRAERNAPEHQARTGVAAPAPARRSSRRTAVHNASKEGKVQHAGASQSRRSRVGPEFQCAIPEVGAGRERLMAAQKGSGAGYPNLGQTCYLGACIQAIRNTLSLHEGIVEAKERSKGKTPLLNALIEALTKPSKNSVKRLTGLRVHKDSYASNAEHDAGEYLTFLRCARRYTRHSNNEIHACRMNSADRIICYCCCCGGNCCAERSLKCRRSCHHSRPSLPPSPPPARRATRHRPSIRPTSSWSCRLMRSRYKTTSTASTAPRATWTATTCTVVFSVACNQCVSRWSSGRGGGGRRGLERGRGARV